MKTIYIFCVIEGEIGYERRAQTAHGTKEALRREEVEIWRDAFVVPIMCYARTINNYYLPKKLDSVSTNGLSVRLVTTSKK